MSRTPPVARATAPRLAAVCCDVDGVLLKGQDPVPGAKAFLQEIARRRVPLALLTNHAEADPRSLAHAIRAMGYPLTPEGVITSAGVTARHLRAKGVRRVFMVGGPVLASTLSGAGVTIVEGDEPAEAVVVGYVHRTDAATLSEAVRRILGGAWFVATNGDVVVPTRYGVGVEVGAWIALLRAAGAGPPTVLGKPSPAAFAMALDHLGTPGRLTLMVGDTVETDIAGAKAMGMPTCRVRSGNAPSDAAADATADAAFDDVGALAASWSIDDPFTRV